MGTIAVLTTRRYVSQLEFHRYWSLKESYIKAIGDGIGFGLQRMSFVSAPELLTEDPSDGSASRCAGMMTPKGLSLSAASGFQPLSPPFLLHSVHVSATLDVDGQRIHGWILEQAMLDDVHPVAVAVEPGGEPVEHPLFSRLDMADVLAELGTGRRRRAGDG